MSTLESPPSTRRSTHNRLTELQKRAAIAWVAQGQQKGAIAEKLGCHVNTISRLCAGVAGLPNRRISGSLESFREVIDVKSFSAIEASVDDREDVHRAAITGLSWLKGVGVLQGDNQVNVTVQAMIADIPPDWRDDMILTPDPQPQDVVKDCTNNEQDEPSR